MYIYTQLVPFLYAQMNRLEGNSQSNKLITRTLELMG